MANLQTVALVMACALWTGLASGAQSRPCRVEAMKPVWRRVHVVSTVRDQKWTLRCTPATRIEAYAQVSARTVTISAALVARASPDGLAAVIGHELAHAALPKTHTGAGRGRAIGLERAADALGALYAALAGYDPGEGLALLRLQDRTEASRIAAYAAALDRTRHWRRPGQINPHFRAIVRRRLKCLMPLGKSQR